jgi:hypothetical protein
MDEHASWVICDIGDKFFACHEDYLSRDVVSDDDIYDPLGAVENIHALRFYTKKYMFQKRRAIELTDRLNAKMPLTRARGDWSVMFREPNGKKTTKSSREFFPRPANNVGQRLKAIPMEVQRKGT